MQIVNVTPARAKRHARSLAALFLTALLAGCMTRPAPRTAASGETEPPPAGPALVQLLPPVPQIELNSLGFGGLEDWTTSDPRPALQAFQRSCAALLAKPAAQSLGGVDYAGTAADWRPPCEEAARAGAGTPAQARAYFEANFLPYRVSQNGSAGLFTGYYEPLLRGSRTRHGSYQTPLYGMPEDIVAVDLGLFDDELQGMRITGRVLNRRLVPYPARAEIVRGLPGARPLFYVDDAIDAFFLQVQGSGRIQLDDGRVVRAAYAGQNGYPYTAIGAVLVDRGELSNDQVSLQSIKAWMLAHPAEADALMNQNESYVFFSEQPVGDASLGAIGSQGVALTPEASIAIDMNVHPLGMPIWLETYAPDPDPTRQQQRFDRLVVTQDSGGAIRGTVRGDVYWGFGAKAASVAGRMRSEGRVNVFLPRAVAARLGEAASFAAPR